MTRRSDALALLARAALALLFIWSGWGKLTGFAGTVGYIAGKDLPMPQVLAVVALAIELGAAILLLIGWKARCAAFVLVIFLLVITPIFHNFWSVPANQMQNQQIHFLKNLAILGGMLMVIAFGPGRFSVDRS
jgi:putative oxidoreductase